MTTPRFTLTRRRLLATAAAGATLTTLAAAPARLMAQEPVRVAGVYTVPVEQQWVSRIHLAAETAQERGDIAYTFTENVSNTDYARVLREYAESGTQLILGEVFGVEQEAREVAADYPNVAFLFGSSFMPDPALPNVGVFDNYIQDAAYLSGLIAGAMTESANIGMVGGFPIPEVNRLMHAFMAGAREMNPEIRFQVAFIGSWFDPPRAKETAFGMIEAGADVMYAERFGVADAAQERGVLAIGNVIDTQADYPDTVVASAIWHFEPTLEAAVSAVRDGTFTAENYGVYSYMINDGSSLAPLGTFEGRVPAEVMELVTEREAEIRAGEFEVEINDDEPRSS
ncbi:MAG TPA: BMP family ABC transporter substrate-binding protein [Paracoccus sp.]|nr:BMP family ABC transporter substrate-binding protein [Paracoccus sp. (in: a-proteobacteria)]